MEKTNLELFRQALTEAVSSKIDSVIEGCDEEFEISDRHKTAMQAILDGTYEKKSFWKLNKAKVAAILVAAALLLASCAVIYRDEIGGFIKEVYDEYVQFVIDKDNEGQIIEQVYEFTYVPDGYVLEETHKTPSLVRYEYEDAENNFFNCHQYVRNAIFGFDAESEDYAVETINIGGIEINCTTTKQSFYYLWSDGVYAFFVQSSQPIEYSELEKIIEGIK